MVSRKDARLSPTMALWIAVGLFAMGVARADPPFLGGEKGAVTQGHDNSRTPLPQLEEIKSGGPCCGVYSLMACLESINVNYDIKKLINPEFVSSSRGSSAAELIKAAEASQAHARAFVKMSVANLWSAKFPLILHVRGNGADRNYLHWVAYLGMDGGKVRILDLPHSLETVAPAELMARWDGLAVAVSREPIEGWPFAVSGIEQVSPILMILCAILACRLAGLGGVGETSLRSAIAIAISAAACSIGYHATSEVGFLRNPSAVAEVDRRYHTGSFPIRTYADLATLLGKNEATLIDARRAADYRLGAIPGAINMSVDSTLTQRQFALRGVSKAAPIVVYCQSAGCPYSDEIAEFLRFNGYENVSIYRGGYREWQKQAVESAATLSETTDSPQ